MLTTVYISGVNVRECGGSVVERLTLDLEVLGSKPKSAVYLSLSKTPSAPLSTG